MTLAALLVVWLLGAIKDYGMHACFIPPEELAESPVAWRVVHAALWPPLFVYGLIAVWWGRSK